MAESESVLIAYFLVPNRLAIVPDTIGIMANPQRPNQSRWFFILSRRSRKNELVAPRESAPYQHQ